MSSHSSFTHYTYVSPHGTFTIQTSETGIVSVSFGSCHIDGREKPSTLTNAAASELQEYFAGKRKEFSVPLDIQGTPFQKEVWNTVLSIPYGHACTAKDIAEQLGKPNAYRSIGLALKQCQLAPFIPIHRIETKTIQGDRSRLYHAFLALEKCALSK